MPALTRPDGVLHLREDGPPDGPAVLFLHSLGTDLRLWDAVLPLMPAGLRLVRIDLRGHGLSMEAVAAGIEDHAGDAIAVIERIGRPVTLVGLSMGGLVAQAVASLRPDIVRALVLSSTASRLGSPEGWAARIAAIQAGGMAAVTEAVIARWFAPAFRATPEAALWRTMLERTSPQGYVAACRVLAATDLTARTAALRLPTLVLCGELDEASPPDQVRALAALIPGAHLVMLPGAGHLPCVEVPQAWAARVAPFLSEHEA